MLYSFSKFDSVVDKIKKWAYIYMCAPGLVCVCMKTLFYFRRK